MARFNSYDKKEKPSGTDTFLVYDGEESPDALKQVEIEALFEEFDGVTFNGRKMTVKEAIEALLDGAGAARYS